MDLPPTESQVPREPGFRALVWIASLAAVLIVLWLVMMYVMPAPRTLGSWRFPGATVVTSTNVGALQSELWIAPGAFDSVTGWYSRKLDVEDAGDPAFTMTTSPFGGMRRCMKISLPKSAAGKATWYWEMTDKSITAAKVSPAAGNPATSVWLIRLNSPPNGPVNKLGSLTFDPVSYPGAQSGAGGAAVGCTAYQFTSPDSPDRMMAHYLKRFGAAAGTVLAPGAGITTGPAAGNQLWRLPEPPNPGLEQTTLLLLTPTNLCFVHLSRATNAERTDMILGVINR